MTELSDEGTPFMKPVDPELQKWLQVGTCTFVCCYYWPWASLLRKVLFSHVQLRCKDDVNRLLSTVIHGMAPTA